MSGYMWRYRKPKDTIHQCVNSRRGERWRCASIALDCRYCTSSRVMVALNETITSTTASSTSHSYTVRQPVQSIARTKKKLIPVVGKMHKYMIAVVFPTSCDEICCRS